MHALTHLQSTDLPGVEYEPAIPPVILCNILNMYEQLFDLITDATDTDVIATELVDYLQKRR